MSAKFLKLDLQLFAEAASAGEASQAAAVNESETAQTQTAPEDRKKQYEDFKSNFKAEFDAEVQGLIKNRLKSAKENEKAAQQFRDKTAKVFDALSVKYGVKADDLDSIIEAVDKDNSFYEEEAVRLGMDVNEFRKVKQIERENATLRQQNENYERQRQNEEKYRNWIEQSRKVQEIYPGFDINQEVKDPNFLKLIDRGVDVQTAYEIRHKDEIITAGMKYAAAQTAAKMQQSAADNRSRVSENGIGENRAAGSTLDISKLTREQMEDIKRRAAAGERITLK